MKIKTTLNSFCRALEPEYTWRGPDELAKSIFSRFRELCCLVHRFAVKLGARAFQVIGDAWRLAIELPEFVGVVSKYAIWGESVSFFHFAVWYIHDALTFWNDDGIGIRFDRRFIVDGGRIGKAFLSRKVVPGAILYTALENLHLVHLFTRSTGIPTSVHSSVGTSTTLCRVARD